ncbi:MAG: ATP-binding protein [Flavobacteriales bacterium]|nr:ATP-binding protein [Flavobacteriales bacterium]
MIDKTPFEETKKLRFASKLENITLVEKLIDDVCEIHTIDRDYYGNILVALTEAVNNAISHGNNSDPEKHVSVIFESKKDNISFEITDEGEGFDPTNLPDPTSPENIEKPYGRGIFLIKHLSDEVEFSDEGRTVNISFNVPALATAS